MHGPRRCRVRAHQQEVCLAVPAMQPGVGLQPRQQATALGHDQPRLPLEHVEMLQRHLGGDLVQRTDVVRQADLVELGDPARIADQVTQAQPREPQLRQRAHDQQVRVLREQRRVVARGEREIGLVDHDQRIGRLQHRAQARLVEQVAGGIVRTGQEDQPRPVQPYRRRSIAGTSSWKSDRSVTSSKRTFSHCEIRRNITKDGAGASTQHPGPGDAGDQHLDDLVAAVAEQDPPARVDAEDAADACAQRRRLRIGVAVQRRGGDAPGEQRLQRRGQRKRVLHRIELDQAARVGDVVGRGRAHVGAHQGTHPVRGIALRHAPSPSLRTRAAADSACACSDSDSASTRARPPSRSAPAARTADQRAALLEIVHAERRGESRRARGRQHVAGTRHSSRRWPPACGVRGTPRRRGVSPRAAARARRPTARGAPARCGCRSRPPRRDHARG